MILFYLAVYEVALWVESGIFSAIFFLASLAFLGFAFRFGERAMKAKGISCWRNVGATALFVLLSQVCMCLSLSLLDYLRGL